MTTLPDRLRSIYVSEGANYVQEAAREIERLTSMITGMRESANLRVQYHAAELADVVTELADVVAERDAAFAMSGCQCATDEACKELAKLHAEAAQLRQYLDTAQRRAAALGDEVAGLREALHSIAWSRPPGRTSKMVEALEKKALAALAARKGEA